MFLIENSPFYRLNLIPIFKNILYKSYTILYKFSQLFLKKYDFSEIQI